MTLLLNQQWCIRAHPNGPLQPNDLVWQETVLAPPGPGQVLVRAIYLSIDPSARLRIDAHAPYSAQLAPGAVVPGRVIGIVEQSGDPRFAVGDLVQGDLGWQRYALTVGSGLSRLDLAQGTPLIAAFAVLGHIGLTAYIGVLDIGRPQAGETLVITAAAGAVGSIAGQIGKIIGCRVVGLARGAEKCRWLTAELGFDAAIDMTVESPAEGLRRTCPDGVDVAFENVGGAGLDAILERINPHGRIALCGLIAHYNAATPLPGPANFASILTRRVRVEGFLNFDYQDRFPAYLRDLARWLHEGKLRYRVEVMQGLEQAPQALGRLFGGSHLGKLVVQVAPEPTQ
jgi:hypothetical protein